MPEEAPPIEKPETSPQTEEDLSEKAIGPEGPENAEEIQSPGEEGQPEEQDLTEEEINSIQPGKASPLDPDFLLIFIVALIADLAIDPFMETVGAVLTVGITLVINRIIDIITLFIIGGWIYWKSKQFVVPEKLAQRMKKMEAKVTAKIQAKISKKVASKALRKALIRVIPALGIEMIPAISIFTSWVAAVISMVI